MFAITDHVNFFRTKSFLLKQVCHKIAFILAASIKLGPVNTGKKLTKFKVINDAASETLILGSAN